MAEPCVPKQHRVTPPAARILLGLVLLGTGIILVSAALGNVTMGRPVSHAWAVAVLGLVLAFPGVVVTARAIFSALAAHERDAKGRTDRRGSR